MAQIIEQPSTPGDVQRYAIWSGIEDDFTHLSLTEDEVIRYFASKAYEDARARAIEIMEKLRKGERPYLQFTLTWGQANERHHRSHPDAYEFEQHLED